MRWQHRAGADRVRPATTTRRSGSSSYGYDPRVGWIEDRYYVTWCNWLPRPHDRRRPGRHDFETFHQLENAFLPFNRNGVLFPRKIGGKLRDAQPARATTATRRSATSSTARAPT